MLLVPLLTRQWNPLQAPQAIVINRKGKIGGAFAGPELAKHGKDWIGDVPYSGTMLALAGLYAVQAILFLFLKTNNSFIHPLKTLEETCC